MIYTVKLPTSITSESPTAFIIMIRTVIMDRVRRTIRPFEDNVLIHVLGTIYFAKIKAI